MAIETVIHSNALNATELVQNDVDPRTGQYALSINLPLLAGNEQRGPALPIRLVFNPFSDKNVGFGRGWYLELTQFVPSTRMLRLHTGESFKVTGSGAEPSIRERKLESFRFFDDSNGNEKRYRVVHRTYLEEILSEYGTGDRRVALPSEVRAASGHRLLLSYTPDTQRLERIVDGTGLELLRIRYGSSVIFDLHPNARGANKPLAQYTLLLSNEQLNQINLPTDVGGNWRFEYTPVFGLTCLSKVYTPYGSIEDIRYGERGDKGHLLPGGGTRSAIPRVTTHVVNPGAGQPPMKTTYTYTVLQEGVEVSHNFVGYGSDVTWRDDGEDNLYRASSAYQYGSTAHQWGKGADGKEQVIRTVQRVYNRFHLQVREVVVQGHKRLATDTTYHGKVTDGFDNQPKNFQLPLEQTRSWSELNDASRVRYEPATRTECDLHGNLIAQTLPSGQRTEIEYYAAGGEEGCPPDPDGFVRNQKCVTEHPAPQGDKPAPVLRKRYEYESLARVGDGAVKASASNWLVLKQESLHEVVGEKESAALQTTFLSPVDDLNDPLRHGRLKQQIVCMQDKQTTTDFEYSTEVVKEHPALVTQQKVTGFDHDECDPETGQKRNVSKTITLKESILIGQPLLSLDDNDVEIAYEYDALRRVVRETVSPGKPFEASRTYAYGLVSAVGDKASQEQVDVKGVCTRSWIDGLGRVSSEERHDADADNSHLHQVFRPRNAFTYDELGQLIQATEYDWLEDKEPSRMNQYEEGKELSLTTRYDYDDWGQQCCEIGPDGVKHFQYDDPIGSNPLGSGPSNILPTQTRWSESADGTLKLGKTTTWLNLFEQPAVVQRFDLADGPYAKQQFFYDGLGRTVRTVREIDTRRAVPEVNARSETVHYSYDHFGRLVEHTLADKSVVKRTYAEHSSDDLPVFISVNGSELGRQTFDGLNRMITSVTGGRTKHLYYAPGQMQPNEVKTASGHVISYEYIPQLGEEPKLRRIPGKQAEYEFDPHNARLTRCKEEGEELSRAYFSTGEIKQECRTIGDQTWTMEYGTSLLGRQLSYQDVLGQVQTYTYYASGLLERTELGTTSSQFFYDGLSNIQCILTLDGTQGLATEIEYDHQGRECLRRFVFLNEVVETPIDDFTFANETVKALVEAAGLQVQGVQTLTQAYSMIDQITSKCLSERSPVVRNGKILRTRDRVLRQETYVYDVRGRLEEYSCEGLPSYSPQDPAGKIIRYQLFEFDALDNITWVFTQFEEADGSLDDNRATYHFDNDDPAQLTRVENTHADYADFTLTYDMDGNMTRDDKGKVLMYDALGRLSSYDGNGYGYDPLDRLASQEA
jgi:YD repeat-containing protein